MRQHIIRYLRNAAYLLLIVTHTKCDEINLDSFETMPIELRQSIRSLSTAQQKEVFKVLKRFSKDPKDSLKLEAAYFLIKELPQNYYLDGQQIRDFDIIFDVLRKRPEQWKKGIPWYGNQIDEIFDSLEVEYGRCCPVQMKFDKEAMTSDLLIKNIELAFQAWEQPWARRYSFEQFCEYILPYRTMDERLDEWRDIYNKRFSKLADALNDSTDIKQLAKLISDSAKIRYQEGIDRYPVRLEPSDLLVTPFAGCWDIANHKTLAMRSMGVASSIDFVPAWGNISAGHAWNMPLDWQGEKLWIEDLQTELAYNWTLTKVYRYTYSPNPLVDEMIQVTKWDCPSFFYSQKFVDVTDKYVPVSEFQLALKRRKDFKDEQYVFLCQFNKGRWYAVDFAKIQSDSVAHFQNIGREAIYIGMYYQNGQHTAATDPFLLTKEGELNKLIPSYERKLDRVVLQRKSPLRLRKVIWLQSLLGAEIQVSDDSSFSSYEVIGTIAKTPSQYLEALPLTVVKPARYARLAFSKEELELPYWGDGASIAELIFFDSDGNKLEGTPFGTLGIPYNEYLPENVFDGNALTFYEDQRDTIPKYVGLDFGKPERIGKVLYQARNDLNSIQIGDTYELMVYDDSTFVSLGKKVATDTLLVYHDIPSNGVYWLRNLSSGVEERIFQYEDAEQVWW